MPYRLGMPTRKFSATFFDPELEKEGLPFVDCFVDVFFYEKSPEEVLAMAQRYAEMREIKLVTLSEVLWEEKIDA